MSPIKLLAGFAPWIAYVLVVSVAGARGVPAAVLLALAVALVLVAQALLARRAPKLLAVAAAVVFTGYGLVALTVPGVDPFLADYGRAVAAVLLAVIIIVLLPVLPFTEQFARETTPRQVWSSPRFRATNRRVSAVWAAAIAGSGIANAASVALVEGHPDAHRGLLPFLLRIGVPVLLFLGAVRFTQATVTAAGSARSGDETAHRGRQSGRTSAP